VSAAVLAQVCSDCGAELAAGLLACPGCARLTHAQQLAELAQAAEACEREGDASAALSAWRSALELLPPGTQQRALIETRMRRLSAMVDGRAAPASSEGAPERSGKHAGKLAGLGVLGLVLLKSKALLGLLLANGKLLLVGLMKLPTLLSMLLYARWTAGNGAAFGIGLVASIYVHEVGHVAALRRYGIAASAPMFVPGLGAFVRLKQYPSDAHEEARTGLAGPLWGLWAALAAVLLGKLAGWPTALSIASVGATINLFNLIPIWQLDGARGLKALTRVDRVLLGLLGLLTGVLLRQWMPAIVGVFALAHALSKDLPDASDRRVLALFMGLLVCHALIATTVG
jgi:Zn-dependent protease